MKGCAPEVRFETEVERNLEMAFSVVFYIFMYRRVASLWRAFHLQGFVLLYPTATRSWIACPVWFQ